MYKVTYARWCNKLLYGCVYVQEIIYSLKLVDYLYISTNNTITKTIFLSLLYGCVYIQEIIHLLKLVDYLPVHTHNPYNNLHLSPDNSDIPYLQINGPRHEKTCLRGFQQSEFETSLLSYSD